MISERLRQLRKQRKMTQVQLAQASGVAQNYISELENGAARNPSAEKITRLARALSVAEAELTTPFVPHLVDGEAIPPIEQPTVGTRDHHYAGYRILAQRESGDTYTQQLVVEVDGRPLPAHYWESLGVEWGYVGAGPQALAYDILAYEFGDTLARNHLPDFAEEVIAHFPRELWPAPGLHREWSLTSQEIRDWLTQHGRPEHIRVYWSAEDWVAQKGELPRQVVRAQFLPARRLAMELERKEVGTNYIPVVRWAIEEELHSDPHSWLVWRYVREVAENEYYLFQA